MLKWNYDHELEYFLDSMPELKNKIRNASSWRQKKEKPPKELRLEIFLGILILKKKILKKRYQWTQSELRNLFSEKITLQSKLIEKQIQLEIIEKENRGMKNELERLKLNQ
ncbi:hypothetical protein AB3N59_14530 [Leptospira sp. WS92.C1]